MDHLTIYLVKKFILMILLKSLQIKNLKNKQKKKDLSYVSRINCYQNEISSEIFKWSKDL